MTGAVGLEHQALSFRLHGILHGAGESGVESETVGLVGCEADYHHIVCKGGDGLTCEGGLPHPVLHPCRCLTDIQPSAVIGCLFVIWKSEEQAAQCLVGHTVSGCLEVLSDQMLRLTALAGKNQFSHLRQHLQGIWIVIPVGTSSPHGFLVELDFLMGGATVNHSTQARIAQRKGFCPSGGRMVIP